MTYENLNNIFQTLKETDFEKIRIQFKELISHGRKKATRFARSGSFTENT